jgi:hypothetical protein
LLVGLLPVFILMRFGLLASLAGWSVASYFQVFPMTLHASAWYSSIGFTTLFIVLAFTLYGFWTSLGNRPLWDAAGVED